MAIAAQVYEVAGDERRFDARVPLGRAGTVRSDDQCPVFVTVDDLTRDGCRIGTAHELSPGAIVAVGIAGVGLTQARVMWRDAASYGCLFIRSLPRGAVTAAFAPSNVSTFPATLRPAGKWSARATLALLVGMSALAWGTIVGALYLTI